MTVEPMVLVVDDEVPILRLLKIELSAQGFRVITASNGAAALEAAESQRPDIAVLDVLMPNMDGLELMREMRERWATPVIFLTARDKHNDKIRGLELGADDYIVKPFNPDEVGARIRAVLRRATATHAERVVKSGDVEVDLIRRRVTRAGAEVTLTRTEWLLLQHLAANAGKVMFNAELLSKVWGPEYRDEMQYLRVWISRLRQKLGDTAGESRLIKTLPSIGYMFLDDTNHPGASPDAEEAATVEAS